MRFQNVCLESIGVCLPDERLTSEALERRLSPVYQRLRLPEGRLQLMTGIAERRIWPADTLPSGPSITSGRRAIEAAELDRGRIGALVHASVCRDFLEPATASRVHDGLGLAADCWVYDVSNACLGLLNGAVQIATLIEAGAIRAGLVVGTENSRPLLEQTLRHLNHDTRLTRKTIKPAFASLTIGSGSCAWLLVDRRISRHGAPLEVAVPQANTAHHALCRSDSDAAGAGMQPLMDTDSERLLEAGVATGAAAFERFLEESEWQRDRVDRSVCHQVGGRHRAEMLAAFGLPAERDVVTFPWLGNTGSVALPLTLAAAARWGHIAPGHRVGLFGIGSGINSVMLGMHWQAVPVAGNLPETEPVASGTAATGPVSPPPLSPAPEVPS